MESVLRAVAIYAVLMILFRIAGRRTLSEMTTFDFVLLLVIGEATQQALLGEDFSITNAVLVIATLIGLDVVLSALAQRSKTAAKVMDGVPMVIVAEGEPLRDRLRMARVDEAAIMEAARQSQGLERLDQIKYAVLEVSGGITIIPNER